MGYKEVRLPVPLQKITRKCFAGLAEEGGKSWQRGLLTLSELTQNQCSLLSIAFHSRIFDCALPGSVADHVDRPVPCNLAGVR